MDCKEASLWMHEYLDGTLAHKQVIHLKEHLLRCENCHKQLDQLEQVEGILLAAPALAIPELSTEHIMRALPRQRKRAVFGQWIRRHPAVSVAVVFLMVMMSSIFSLWHKENSLVEKATDLEEVVIKGDLVIVPAGHIMQGDLTIENGKLQVDGVIEGNLTIIDGSVNMASTALIAGQVTSINQTIDHFWFRVKEFFSGFSR